MDRYTQRWVQMRFQRVPQRHTTTYDWQAAEGREFLDVIELMVEDGVDINEIGSVLGIPNFSQRFRILRRGNVGRDRSAAVTHGDSNEDPQPGAGAVEAVLPKVWGVDAEQGQAGSGG